MHYLFRYREDSMTQMSIAEVIEDEVKEDVAQEPVENVEETKQDIEEVQTYVEPVADEVKDSVDGVVQEAAQDKIDTSKIVDEIVSKLKPQEDGKKYPWDEEGRQPTWTEALELVKKQAKEELKSELEQEKAHAEEEKRLKEEQEQSAQREYEKSLQTMWADQLTDLTRQGLIPPIKDMANENDEGRKVRLELFKIARENQEIDRGNLVAAFTRYERSRPQKPPGSQVPVVGTRSGAPSSQSNEFSYAELRNYGSISEIEG
jgi:hypothetical protein